MSSAAGAIALLLAGTGVPATAAAQDGPAAPASLQDPALYQYIDDADALLDAMGTSPPDYGFRFEGLDCWGWSMSDGYLILAEPLGDDYRFYVFGPDDDQPFFVGDQYYAYGFEGRALAAVYGENGELVAWDPSDQLAAGAAWLSDRGARMKLALDDREPVVASDWADSVGWFGALEIRFDSWRRQPGWLHYRNRPHGQYHRDWRKKLDDEGARRHQRADWFDRWRRGGYRGAAPQGDGKWTTRPPGTHPGRGDGKGGWNGRPRSVAPATPGVNPAGPRPGEGKPGRGPRPPRDGQSGRPIPPVGPQLPSGATPSPVPSLTIVPPSPPAPPRIDPRPDRPQMRRIEGGPAVIGKDRLRDGAELPPTAPPAALRPQPAPLPPPVMVVPRRAPHFQLQQERVSPPPSPPAPTAPVSAAPQPPHAARVVIPPAASRPAPVIRSAPAPRSAPASRSSSGGSEHSSGKSRDR